MNNLKTGRLVLCITLLTLSLFSGCPNPQDPSPPPVYTVSVSAGIANGSITADLTSTEEGTVVTLTVTPNPGYQLQPGSLMYNGTALSGPPYTFAMPAAHVTIIAVFVPLGASQYTIAIQPVTGGSIAASSSAAEAGETITLTATSHTGYRLKAGTLTVNDGDVPLSGSGPDYAFAMPAAHVTVAAEFEALPPGYFNISVVKTGNGSIFVPDSAQSGDAITVTATPANGYQLKPGSLTHNGAALSGPPYTFTMPAAAVTVGAVFEQIAYAVTKGTISGSGNIAFAPASGPYHYGDTITVTATPDTGWRLQAESLKYNSTAISGPPYTFTLPAEDVTLSAVFEQIPYALSKGTISGSGNIAFAPASGPYHYGDTITVTATPATGWRLQAGSLKYNEAAVTGPPYTFALPAEDVTLSAVFEQIPYALSKGTISGNGNITFAPASGPYHYGDTITVTATPATEWRLKAGTLTVNDGEVTLSGSGPDYTFAMPAADVKVAAEFEALPPGYFNILVAKTGEGSISVPDSARNGDTITVTATPATGYQLQAGSLKYNDGTDHTITGTTFTMPAAHVTVAAVFEQIPYAVSTGTITGSGDIAFAPASGPYHYGNTITVTATPDTGWRLQAGSLKYNSTAISGPPPYTFTMPAADVTLSAVFEKTPYTVNVGTLTGGVITIGGGATHYIGDTITVTATPNTGYQLQAGSLKYNNTAISGPPYTFTMPAANVTVTAVFEQITYTVTKTITGSGDIAFAPASGPYHYGDTITVTVTPATGYQLQAESLKYNDGTDHAITGTTFAMPAANVTVSAVFEQASYTVTKGTITGGDISFAPASGPYHYGDTITVTATPDAGYQLQAESLKYNDGTDHAITGTTFTMPADNVTITAVFEQASYTVTKGTITGGDISFTPASGPYHYGDTITVTVTPDTGKKLADDGLKYNNTSVPVSGNTGTFTMPADNVTITAEFVDLDANEHYILITKTGEGSIAVPSTGIENNTITVTVTPAAEWRLQAGSLKFNNTAISGPPYSFTMPAEDVTVTAEFEKIPYTLSAGTISGGSISFAPPGGPYHFGDTIIVTATPDTGYQFKAGSLTYNDGTDHAISGTTFTMPAANVTVSAVFEKTPYTVTTAQGVQNGTISVGGATHYIGDTITVTVTPNTGYQLQAGSLKYNNTAISGPPYTFTMPAENVTVSAVFEKPSFTVTKTITGSGDIAFAPASGPYHSGDPITVAVTPATEWRLKAGSLKYNNTAISGPPYTFTMPAENVTVSAVFEQIPYTVTKGTVSGNGDITFSSGPYYYGATITVTVTPVTGYQLQVGSLTYNDTAISGPPYTFTMPAENVTVAAAFEKAPVPVSSVSVTPPTAQLVVGQTLTLTASVAPLNADNKAVTWSSSDPSKVTVAASESTTTATIAALAVTGQPVTITATTAEGGKTDACAVTVTAGTGLVVNFSGFGDESIDLTLSTGNDLSKGNYDSLEVTYTGAGSIIAWWLDGQQQYGGGFFVYASWLTLGTHNLSAIVAYDDNTDGTDDRWASKEVSFRVVE